MRARYVKAFSWPTQQERTLAMASTDDLAEVVALAEDRGRGGRDLGGVVHRADCFIVTTHSPDSNWQSVPGPATCHYCIERGA